MGGESSALITTALLILEAQENLGALTADSMRLKQIYRREIWAKEASQ